VNRRDKEIEEEICVERFLNWYNKRHKRNYIYKRTEDHPNFTGLKGELRWDFLAYEHDNPEEWIGIEVKELQFLRGTSVCFAFWGNLCSDLNKLLARRRFQGGFEIGFPPPLDLTQRERQRLLEVFSQVLIDKQSGWKAGETKDIGPDVWSKFPKWPTQRSNEDEWDEWGRARPSKLEITKVSDSGYEVRVVTSPLIDGDVVEEEKKAFNAVFKQKNGIIQPDNQLGLAKEKGAKKTLLLLAGIGVDEGLTRNFVQSVAHHLISHIECIYLVDMSDTDRVVKIYPN